MCDKTFNRKNILNKHPQMEHGVVMHDYEHSDYDDAMPPHMQRASVDLNDLPAIREHQEIVTPRYLNWNQHPYRTVAGEIYHTSANIHSL